MNDQNYDSSDSSEPQIENNKGQFRQQTLQQYYRYLNLLKKTNNFCKDFTAYQNLTDHDFEDLAIVGWIFEIENIKLKTEIGTDQQCLSPIVYSNIKDPFKNYQQSSPKPLTSQASSYSQSSDVLKRSLTDKSNTSQANSKSQVMLEPHIRRPLLVLKSVYLKFFIKAFNQVIKQCKEFKKHFVLQTQPNNQKLNSNSNIFNEIQWVYAFTGLKLAIRQGKMYFMVTEKTKIVALDSKFYTQTVEHLQKSVGFPYSYFSMSKKNYDPNSIEEGYSLNALQVQASIVEKLSFTGILKQKIIEEKHTNKKDKELFLVFNQDSLFPHKEMIGQAKVIVKYSIQENQKNLLSFFKIGYVYLVTNATIQITDSVNIIYRLKQSWSEHIFQINIQKSPELNPKVIRQLPYVQMSWLKLANVNRNIIKVKVDLFRCEFFFGKIVCTNCRAIINNQGFCSRFCGQNEGELILWTIALVNDSSTFAEISMERNQTINFFDFTPEHIQDIKKYILAQNSRKMVRLFDRFKHSPGSDSSEQITSFQRVVGVKFVSKSLLAIPRYNVNESFSQNLSEEEKQQFQQSFQGSKEYLKKNKVHFNGYVKKIQKDLRKTVPYLKVIQVF